MFTGGPIFLRGNLKEKHNLLEIIRNTLRDRINLVIFIILAATILYSIIVRFLSLGELSFWGDDGMTYLSTVSVLEHGYPRLPSGYIMFHNIASSYFNIIPVLLFGDNEFAYRFFSALTGVLIIPLIFLFAKELTNKYIASVSSIVIALNTWQIEYSREARYYSEFQFFYILTIYFFYLGFFKDRKVFKVLAIISLFITIQIVSLGVTLIFLFIPLLVYRGLKGFFKRDTIISFLASGAIVIAVVIHRELFWKVGLSFYSSGNNTDIANPVLGILYKYFGNFSAYYYRIFGEIYPKAFPLFIYGGIALILVYIFIKRLRNQDEHNISILNRSKASINIPFNLLLLYFIFFSNALFYGSGNMYNQHRYIYHMNPVFIIISAYIIFELSKIIIFALRKIFVRGGDAGFEKIKDHSRKYLYIILVIFIGASAFAIDHIDMVENFKITSRQDGDPVNPIFTPSSTFSIHYDVRTASEYIGSRLEDGDIVISTYPLKTAMHIKQVDHWVWSANLVSWQPYRSRDGIYYDNFFGVPLIRDLFDLQKVLNENPDKNIWIASIDSIERSGHVDPMIIRFLEENSQCIEIVGKDGVSSAYLFPALEDGGRAFSMYDNVIPGEDEVIRAGVESSGTTFLFNDRENDNYLRYGWSFIESTGTWADQKSSLLFLDFEELSDHYLDLAMKALPDPDIVQEVEVFLNGKSIGKFVLENVELTEYTAAIPGELLVEGYNVLELRSKFLMSPVQLGINEDPRNLATYFSELKIYK